MTNEKLNINSMYVNNVSLDMGIYDFSLTLSTLINQQESLDEIKVFMSPQHAKSLALMLINSVEEYEKVFGEINLNPNMKDITK